VHNGHFISGYQFTSVYFLPVIQWGKNVYILNNQFDYLFY